MPQVDGTMVGLVEDILVSYESQISTTGILIDTTYELLQESQRTSEQLSSQLRDRLAANSSLRKKDFDTIMAELQFRQTERQRGIKEGLSKFTRAHAQAAARLRTLLSDVNSGKAVDFKMALADIQGSQDAAEEKVVNLLKDSHQEQDEFMAEAHRLLSNDGAVGVRDLKESLSKLKTKATFAR